MSRTTSASRDFKAVTVYLKPEDHRELKHASIDMGSMSEILRDLALEWLEAYRNGQSYSPLTRESGEGIQLTTEQIAQLKRTHQLLGEALHELNDNEDNTHD